MRKISITEALNELKLYDSKINKAINSATLVGAAKKSSAKVGVVNTDEFENKAKSSYQSITDLIANRNTLKSAIVKSNAITEVSVDGKIMTVAEVIERKNSIVYDQNLLNAMKVQYASSTLTVNKENKRVDDKVDELIQTLAGKDSAKKLDKEAIEAVEKPYREQNEWVLVDPIKIFDEMTKLESDIDGFLANCDTTLAVANASTFIEIDF